MITIPMPRKGQVGLAREVEKLLRHLEGSVEKVSVVDAMTLGVALAPGAPPDFAGKIPGIVLDYVRGYKDFRPNVVATSQHKAEACVSSHDFDCVEVARGVRSESGLKYELHRFLVATFDGIYRAYNPHRMSSPSMISRKLVERLGYFKKFPNLANFVANFRNEYPLFKGVSDGSVPLDADLRDHVEISDTMLNPVTCYQVYPQASQSIARTGKTSFVTDGSAYRYEANNMGRLRLNEFHTHELVFFGSKAGTMEMRQTMLQRYVDLFNRWQIEFVAETASDMFYGTDAGSYIATQRLEQAKIELGGQTDTGYHSFASFNLHGTHYTKLFDIEVPGVEEPYSACFGHGVERMMYVILSQLGDDPEAWPDAIRADFGAFRGALR